MKIDIQTFNLLAANGDPAWGKWASIYHRPDRPVMTWDEHEAEEGTSEPLPPAELPGLYFEPPQVTAAKAKAEAREGRE